MKHIDYRGLRGANYGFPGDDAQMRRELSYGRRVGLNALRVWLSYGRWKHDGEAYIAGLVRAVRTAFACGYRVMPILFNGNGENSASLPDGERPDMERYVSAVVGALKDEPGLLLWDIMNEPLCCWWIGGAQGGEKEARIARVWDFVRHFTAFVRSLDGENPITVGYTSAWEIEETSASLCDVLSFHDYNQTRAGIDANFSLAEQWGKKLGLPVLQTETGCLARSNPYDVVLEACERYGMGWFVFELMIHGRCDSEHGVFYPDGTVRDPATIAAMMGCYRCRDLDVMILPVPNREGSAARAVEEIKKALTEYTDDAFDYRPSDIGVLLEAAEHAANLLECCDMTPMACPPTARILAWRKMLAEGKKPALGEVRAFAYGQAKTLKELCQLL